MWKSGLEKQIHPAAQRDKKDDYMFLLGLWRKKKKTCKIKTLGLYFEQVRLLSFCFLYGLGNPSLNITVEIGSRLMLWQRGLTETNAKLL